MGSIDLLNTKAWLRRRTDKQLERIMAHGPDRLLEFKYATFEWWDEKPGDDWKG